MCFEYALRIVWNVWIKNKKNDIRTRLNIVLICLFVAIVFLKYQIVYSPNNITRKRKPIGLCCESVLEYSHCWSLSWFHAAGRPPTQNACVRRARDAPRSTLEIYREGQKYIFKATSDYKYVPNERAKSKPCDFRLYFTMRVDFA